MKALKPTPLSDFRIVQGMAKRFSRKIDSGGLDLEYRCMFREQLTGICSGLQYGNGEQVEIPMKSGRIAIYQVTSERYNYTFEDTGQRNWFFKFIRYKD